MTGGARNVRIGHPPWVFCRAPVRLRITHSGRWLGAPPPPRLGFFATLYVATCCDLSAPQPRQLTRTQCGWWDEIADEAKSPRLRARSDLAGSVLGGLRRGARPQFWAAPTPDFIRGIQGGLCDGGGNWGCQFCLRPGVCGISRGCRRNVGRPNRAKRGAAPSLQPAKRYIRKKARGLGAGSDG